MKTMTSVISRRKPLLPIAAAIAVMVIPESDTEFILLDIVAADVWPPCMSIIYNNNYDGHSIQTIEWQAREDLAC